MSPERLTSGLPFLDLGRGLDWGWRSVHTEVLAGARVPIVTVLLAGGERGRQISQPLCTRLEDVGRRESGGGTRGWRGTRQVRLSPDTAAARAWPLTPAPSLCSH